VRAFFLFAAVFVAAVAAVYAGVVFIAFPLKYKAEIQAAAAEYNVPAALIAGVIRSESRFNPTAVSDKGAVGLMQIMPSTAEYINKIINSPPYGGVDAEGGRGGFAGGGDLTDPRTNIFYGTFYLRYLLDKFGDEKTALFAYNAGETKVRAWLGGAERLETTPYRETNAYAERVLNAKNYYRYRV